MFLKIIFLTLLMFNFTLGCAKARYVNQNNGSLEDSTAQEEKADCSTTFTNSGLCLSWSWEKIPTANTKGSLIFKIYRLNIVDQTPIEIDNEKTPLLVLWMPSMGHGSSSTKTERLDVGTYRASNVFFIMPGEWELKFQIKDGTQVIDEAKVNITF